MTASKRGKTTRRPRATSAKPIQSEKWLGQVAQIDPLTALPNRTQFYERLSRAIARAGRSGHSLGVMLLNLDHFKELNARHGHLVADLVLKRTAERLTAYTRKGDTLARLGGDEFAVILEGLTLADGATVAARRLLEVLGQPLELENHEVAVTATVGVALYPSDADNVDTLLQNADFAVFHAREYNRNTCQFYSPELRVRTRHHEAWRAKIEKGLASLTPREREVGQILVAGNANKMIGYMLGASMRTIESHRASIMKKMDAHSLPELVRMVIEIRGHLATVEAAKGKDGGVAVRQGKLSAR
jgi:diguanylate cyclase (GGDEF)-like protein